MANDFKAFAAAGGANVYTQTQYLALAGGNYIANGNLSGIADSKAVNKVARQASIMAAVIAQLIIDRTGQDAIDDGTTATLLANLKLAFPYPPIGQTRNAGMLIAAPTTTALYTADQVTVGTSLGAPTYTLSAVSQNINLATVGAGGMDTGTPPAPGFVGVYLIYNPLTGARALLAVNGVTAKLPEVYGGGNMPAGYTASALVSVWPTNASSQFEFGSQIDRTVNIASKSVINSNSVQAGIGTVTSAVFPKNAKSVSGSLSINSSAASSMSISIYAAGILAGSQNINASVGIGQQLVSTIAKMNITIPQTTYWTSSNTAGTPTFGFSITSYDL